MKCTYCGFKKGEAEPCAKCRDKFARAALTGILADKQTFVPPAAEVARQAYLIAYYMMKARQGGETP